jgi:peptidoglycan-associated lipoprotein
MRVLLSIVMLPLIAACSTVRSAPAPSAAVAETSGPDVAGRWIGHWTGAGLFDSYREDDVTVDLVQQGDAAVGRIVMQGTTAAESVPEVIRRGGQWGNQVFARVKPGTVTLRHYLDGRLFTVDFRLAEDGEHMTGLVRDSHPKIGLTLTRAPRKVARETPAPTPAPAPPPASSPEPTPQVAMAPTPEPEPKSAEAPAERPKQEEFLASQELATIHFDFDKSDLRSDARDTLTTHATWLKDHEDAAVLIEGHCDERGTSEYNVALGERRANAVRDYLAQNGVASERLSTVSYGKERPMCGADTSDCHEQNRRAEFRVKAH